MMAHKALLDSSSAVVRSKCSSKKACAKTECVVVLDTDFDLFDKDGFQELSKALLTDLKVLPKVSSDGEELVIRCPNECDGQLTFECEFGPLIIINVDHFTAPSDVRSHIDNLASKTVRVATGTEHVWT